MTLVYASYMYDTHIYAGALKVSYIFDAYMVMIYVTYMYDTDIYASPLNPCHIFLRIYDAYICIINA